MYFSSIFNDFVEFVSFYLVNVFSLGQIWLHVGLNHFHDWVKSNLICLIFRLCKISAWLYSEMEKPDKFLRFRRKVSSGSASLQLKLKRKTPELSWFSGPELFPVKTINGITIKQYESGNRPRCQINNLRPSGCIQKAIYAPPEFRGRCYLYFFFCPRHASINNQKDAIHSQWSHCWNFEILKDFWWNRFLTDCGLKVDWREGALGSVSGSANVFHNRGGIGKQSTFFKCLFSIGASCMISVFFSSILWWW